MTETQTIHEIDKSVAIKLKKWWDAGRGVKAWANVDLGSGNVGANTYTPGDKGSPHWSSPNSVDVLPEDCIVRDTELISEHSAKIQKHYWGPWINNKSEAKFKEQCQKLSKELGCDVEHEWVFHPDKQGCALVSLVKIKKVPFTEWSPS
jgi:hypothetical protein